MTGDPVVQEPEKTFLQKYWLYIILALGVLSAFALLIYLGPPSTLTRVSNGPWWRRRSARVVNAHVLLLVFY